MLIPLALVIYSIGVCSKQFLKMSVDSGCILQSISVIAVQVNVLLGLFILIMDLKVGSSGILL